MATGFNILKKTVLFVAPAFLGLSLLFSFIAPEQTVKKVSSKLWTDPEIQYSQLAVPDTMKAVMSFLCKVESGDTLLGYACYASSYGCRIGGCAVPSQPNSQTYETFDFVVVYNAEINVLLIDIVNYSGAYGYEICRAKWLRQFQHRGEGFELNKNIDGITGATISATYLINDMNYLGRSLKILRTGHWI